LLFSLLIVVLIDWQNPIFVQYRLGLNKANFVIYKLRTMKSGKITLLGKIMRKTGIDELPQLINIIKGDMNFVGPRPLTQNDVFRLKWNDIGHTQRWSVEPGITGLAQLVNVCDAKVSWQKDIDYIERRSPALDMKIIWQSALVPFLGKSRVKQQIHKATL
jgi:lipopolysaccharide/colanic/teichoic acid biosynthesis glycosyltransferase